MNEEQEKKEYEIGFLVRSEEQGQEVVKVLHRYQVEITQEGQISKVRLAYPIKKEVNVCFGYLWFKAEPGAIGKIQEDLRLNREVLRFLIVTPPVKRAAKEKLPEAKRNPERSTPQIPPAEIPSAKELTNEDLEKKLEEILQ